MSIQEHTSSMNKHKTQVQANVQSFYSSTENQKMARVDSNIHFNPDYGTA